MDEFGDLRDGLKFGETALELLVQPLLGLAAHADLVLALGKPRCGFGEHP